MRQKFYNYFYATKVKKINDIFFNFSKLKIVMEDQQGGGNDLIDEFTIALSLSGAYNVTLTGNEQLATIALSYQLHCMDSPDCPAPSLSPTSK